MNVDRVDPHNTVDRSRLDLLCALVGSAVVSSVGPSNDRVLVRVICALRGVHFAGYERVRLQAHGGIIPVL